MSQVAYVNGRYLPHGQAMVHVEDRGYQFADAIYEYFAFYHGIILDFERHAARLARSLKAIGIAMPVSEAALAVIARELIARSGRTHGGLYLQVSRGVARRDHPFPAKGVKPSLVMTVCAPKTPKPHEVEKGVSVILQPDQRWGRCDIKSVGLLANVLAKQEAAKAKAREAWLYGPDDCITEGAVSNAYLVTEKDGIVTHPADAHILGGVTRDVALKLAREAGIRVSERPFHLSEINTAQEAFITSTSANILPVVNAGDTVIGSGKPGPVTKKLLGLYLNHIEAQTGYRS